jgi:hypothetical protein
MRPAFHDGSRSATESTSGWKSAEWHAEVLAWKMGQLEWEELLDMANLLLRAPYRSELTLRYIGVKS